MHQQVEPKDSKRDEIRENQMVNTDFSIFHWSKPEFMNYSYENR